MGKNPTRRKTKVSRVKFVFPGLVRNLYEAEMRSRCPSGLYSGTTNITDGVTKKDSKSILLDLCLSV